MRCSSPTRATSSRLRRRRSTGRERGCETGEVGSVAPSAAQCAAAPGGVLDDPLLYPPRPPDQSLDRRERRTPAAAARRGAPVYRRFLARADADDPDRLGPDGADAHADLGPSRRPDHRRRRSLFRHRRDRRLDPTRRLRGVASHAEEIEGRRLRRDHAGRPARPGDDRQRRHRQRRAAGTGADRADHLCHKPAPDRAELGPVPHRAAVWARRVFMGRADRNRRRSRRGRGRGGPPADRGAHARNGARSRPSRRPSSTGARGESPDPPNPGNAAGAASLSSPETCPRPAPVP